MRVVFSDRAYAAVLAETTEKIKTETGGLLLGKLQDDEWYVREAIDPGPKSVFKSLILSMINNIHSILSTKSRIYMMYHFH